MPFPYYTGKREPGESQDPSQLPSSRLEALNPPEGYTPSPGLRDAVNVALVLGQPLLLTGEPGTGKTQLARNVAWALGFEDKPIKFETKSTTTARDLFYTYDTLGRFHSAQTGTGSQRNRDYIDYVGLGLAIIRANDENVIRSILPTGFKHGGRRRSVVLIDEVDKAPRDFPNDILNELELIYFKIPELGNAEIEADKSMRPVVIITSNSEKHLPDAFLRRCIYYDIPFPEDEQLRNIIENRMGAYAGATSPFLNEALELFYALREAAEDKKPATAELLAWLTVLRDIGLEETAPLHHDPARVQSTLSTLIKGAVDQKTAEAVLREWVEGKLENASTEARATLEAWLKTS